MLYIPVLPEDAFLTLPEDLRLEGSPSDYHFPLFKLPEFGSLECAEVAGRVLVALAAIGDWASIDVSCLGDSLIEELVFRVESRYEQCVLYSITSSPEEAIDRLYVAISELVESELLGYYAESPELQFIWPTPAFLERAAPYKV